MSFSDDDWVDPLPTEQRYENEDTSPTTERELKGWYAYPIAAEVNRLPCLIFMSKKGLLRD